VADATHDMKKIILSLVLTAIPMVVNAQVIKLQCSLDKGSSVFEQQDQPFRQPRTQNVTKFVIDLNAEPPTFGDFRIDFINDHWIVAYDYENDKEYSGNWNMTKFFFNRKDGSLFITEQTVYGSNSRFTKAEGQCFRPF
jgi:hypothetical protein